MSGLDSIALAVAHLEKQRERQEGLCKIKLVPAPPASSAESEPPSIPSPTQRPPPVPSRSLPMPPARVVSIDALSPSPKLKPSGRSKSPPSPPPTTKSTFGYILSDPVAWLQKTQARPPLKAPEHCIETVEQGDVLCGRGGETNHHPGNIQYRMLVKAFQPLYVRAKRREKPLIAQCIVYSVRQVGGRFLKRISDKEWVDVGNTKAREKTSQALREGAPELRGDQKHKQPQPQPQMAQPPPGPYQAPESAFLNAFMTPIEQALRGSMLVNPPPQVVAQPAAPFVATAHATNKKRPPVIISDDNSDSESDNTSTTSTSRQGGPRLKRFKKRLELEQVQS